MKEFNVTLTTEELAMIARALAKASDIYDDRGDKENGRKALDLGFRLYCLAKDGE